MATRARLLTVAEELFTQRGYDGTSIQDMAQRAGVSVGTLYHHFSDKRTILLELIDAWADREADASHSHRDFEACVEVGAAVAIAGLLRRAYEKLRAKPTLYMVVLSMIDRDPDVQRSYQRISKLATARWRAFIEFGQGRGMFRDDVHAGSAALLIHNTIDVAATQVLVRGLATPEPEHVVVELTNMICRYLLKEEAP